jgi:hypothetical protein
MSAAILSPCGLYRYHLSRTLREEPGARVLFVMLNPSTADATVDDPTIRRCIGFAEREGGSVLEVVNLYGLRSPEPKALRAAPDPVGPDNDKHLRLALQFADVVICGWGANEGPIRGRSRVVADLALDLGRTPMCLGTTKSGAPRHPLYVRSAQPLVPWSAR